MLADEKGGLSWNGRPAQLCSESEKWRAQASMQLTLAALTGSRIVVLDRADLLDPVGREGLTKAVTRVTGSKHSISVVLCSTATYDTLGVQSWPVVRVVYGRTV